MAGFLNGRHAGFLSEEIFTEDVNIEAADGDLLAEELEQAQEELFIEQEKFNTAIEAECETTETVTEIEAALESGINDAVYAKLLVNKLIKHNTVFYGTSKPLSSGLESDRGSDARSILQAGLEDGKGMVDAIKEFIAKVWQKIKDAFAWVWKKMKDFWAWLTGASKKVEEKKEETVVAASAVNAAVDKSDDIKKAAEDVMENKNPDDTLKRFRKRQNIVKALNANKIDGTSGLTVQDGEFKGKDIGSLSIQDFKKWMNEGKNKDIAVDVIVEDIIIEEVVKQTGMDEDKINRLMPASLVKAVSAFAYNPKLQSSIAKTLNDNFSGNESVLSTITERLARLAFFEVSANTNNSFQGVFKYTPASIQEDYKKFEKDYSLLNRVLGDIGNDASYPDYVESIINRLFKNGYLHNENSDYLDTISIAVNQLSTIIESLKNGIMADWSVSHTPSTPVEIKYFVPLIPVSITRENIVFTNAVTMYKLSPSDIPNFSYKKFEDNIKKYKFTDSIVSDITKIKITDDKKYFSKQQEQSNKLKQSLDNLIVIADTALNGIEKAYEKNMKDADNGMKKDWNNIKFAITAFVGHSKSFSPSIVIEQAKINNDCLNLILDMIDLPRTIIKATKEGK